VGGGPAGGPRARARTARTAAGDLACRSLGSGRGHYFIQPFSR
jgi:hypothetical protein